MATIKFSLEHSRFTALVNDLKLMGFDLVSGDIKETTRDITRDYTFTSEKDYPYGNGYFFLFPQFVDCEKMKILDFVDSDKKQFFAVQRSFGGPYLELNFRVSPETRIVDGELRLRPKFDLRDYSTIGPNDELKEVFGSASV
jgi:hypothetical protein